MNPLIVTLTLDPDSHRRLTELRTRYFPPERNYLEAHVTLFHALPGDQRARWEADLAAAAARTATFAVNLSELYSLGRGVAVRADALEIGRLRQDLRTRWLADLSPQDQRADVRAHVTLQNKVPPDEARATLTHLRITWPARVDARALGLALWEYAGGPWTPVTSFEFQ